MHGIGIGYVSEAEFIPDARLRLVRISDAEIFTAAHVVYLRERAHSRLIRAFLDVVRTTGGATTPRPKRRRA